MLQATQSNSLDEYALMEKKGTALFRTILKGRNEMHDYVTCSLQRGGYNYRQICSIFKVTNITVTFFKEGKIVVESQEKNILFENQKLYIFQKYGNH
ncbi:MAG: hypothetical protein C0490_28370 [Marivirga sp.]|nr:hypothetical protein [Marivirga sp.]